MGIEKVREKYDNYSKVLNRLAEALKREDSDELILDAVIQRFEFTYELSWKLLKSYLEYNGIGDVRTPREAFKEAFAAGIIKEGELWIDMLNDRNLTTHTYDEKDARHIYEKIKHKHFAILNTLKDSLSGEMQP